MSDAPFDVNALLTQGIKGNIAPPGPPQAPGLPDWAIHDTPQAPQEPSGGDFDVNSLLSAGRQGKVQAPPQVQKDESTVSGIANAVPSGLYSGFSGIFNIPTHILNAASDVMKGLTGVDYGHLKPPVETNPTGYQPHGTAERATYAGAQAVGSLPAMSVGGEAVAPFLKAGGIPRTIAEGLQVPTGAPSLSTGGEALAARLPRILQKPVAAGADMASNLPIGPTAQAVGAGAVAGQAASETVPDEYAPYVNLATNALVGAGVGAGQMLAGKGLRAAASKLGTMGVGPRTEIEGAVNPETGAPLQLTQTQIQNTAQRYARSLGPEGQEIVENAPPQQIAGYEPTAAQLAPTTSMVQTEKAFRSAYPDQFIERSQQQNKAHTQAIDTLAGNGNVESPGRQLIAGLDAISAQTEPQIAAATGDVQGANTALGAGGSPEALGARAAGAIENVQGQKVAAANKAVGEAETARNQAVSNLPGGRRATPTATVPQQYGAEARGQLVTNRSAEADRLQGLKDAINPNGDAGTYSEPFVNGVRQVYAGRSASAEPLSSAENGIVSTIQSWPRVVPINDIIDMQQRVNGAIARETAGGVATPVSARLQQVKNALDDALSGAIDNQHTYEQQQVLSGHLSPEQTMEARLKSEVEGYVAAKRAASAGGNPGGRVGGVAGGRQAGISGSSGAEMPPSGRSGNPPGAAGVPENQGSIRPFTPEELTAYRDWRQQYGEFKSTFDERAVGKALKSGEYTSAAQVPEGRATNRMKGGFDLADSEVMPQFWNKTAHSREDVADFLKAGGNPETLKGYAADDLRSRFKDGEFDPAEYAKWRREHSSALHAFPELTASFDSAAKAQTTLAERRAELATIQQGHPLRDVQFPSEIMGRYVKPGDTGADLVRKYVADTGGAKDAMDALDDYIVNRMRDPLSKVVKEDGQIDRAKLADFRAKYSGALSQRPELADKLSSVDKAQAALDDLVSKQVEAIRAYKTNLVEAFMNEDPHEAIRQAFEKGDPFKNLSDIKAKLNGSQEAWDGVKRLAGDYILKKLSSLAPEGTSERDFLQTRAFRQWVDKNKRGIRLLYGGQGVNQMDAIAANMRQQAQRTTATGGSDTVPKALGVAKEGLGGGHGHNNTAIMMLLGEHFAEHLGGGESGVLKMIGGAGLPIASALATRLKQAGIKNQNDLMLAAIMHPTTVGQALSANIRATVPAQRRVAAALQGVIAADLAHATNEKH